MASARTTSTDPKAPHDPTAGSTVNVGIDDANIPDVTGKLKEIAQVALMTPMDDPRDPNCPWGAPVCCWGLPATAKSDMFRQAAWECGMGHAVIMPGQHIPEDFSGVVVPNFKDGGVTVECLLGAVRFLNNIGYGVLFIDEMGEAPPTTQGAMLGMIHDRMVGDTPIKPKVRQVLAGNPPKYSTSGWSLKPATANRMGHFQVKCPPVDDVINHLTMGKTEIKIHPFNTEALIQDRWASAYGRALGLWVGYIKSRPLMLHIEPEPDKPQSSYGWPSPRSWANSIRVFATAIALGKSEEIQQLMVEGFVSEGACVDWFTWQRQADLPTPEDVLARGYVPDMRRIDIAHAVLSSVTQYVTSMNDKAAANDAAVRGYHLFKTYIDHHMGDLAATSASKFAKSGFIRKVSPAMAAASEPVLRWMIDMKLIEYAET